MSELLWLMEELEVEKTKKKSPIILKHYKIPISSNQFKRVTEERGSWLPTFKLHLNLRYFTPGGTIRSLRPDWVTFTLDRTDSEAEFAIAATFTCEGHPDKYIPHLIVSHIDPIADGRYWIWFMEKRKL